MTVRPDEAVGRAGPTVSIGLPVHNGARYLEQSLDALLAQTFTDFELIISDNASTDETADICRAYARRDPRIKYVRQPVNLGAVPNHNVLVDLARGRYFKWASHDDLYAPELLERCVAVLESRPDVVLAHCWDAIVDEHGAVVEAAPYAMATDDPSPAARLRSLLYTPGGNDFYGVIRTEVLRRVGPHGTYYNADRTMVSSLCLHGPFHQVPEILYWRRDHEARASRAGDRRAVAAALDPRRASRLRHPMVRMHVEYVNGYLTAIGRAPLSTVERARCLAEVARWMWSCARRGDRSAAAIPQASGVTLATYGFFGNDNLGNEGTLEAFLAQLRKARPDVAVRCFAVEPEAVRRDHGVEATRLMSYRAGPDQDGVAARVRKGVSRLWDVPRTLHLVRDVDVVVVPGTGALEKQPDVRPWGLPYWLLLVAASCRARGRRMALVCVGADAPPHPLTRRLYRWTVRLCDHTSYRDEMSRAAVRAMGVRGAIGEAHTDLAFLLPAPEPRDPRPGHVVVGVMTYFGSPEDPASGPLVRDAYVERLTELVTRLLDGGGTVTVVVGDMADLALAQELEEKVGALRPELAPHRVWVSKADDLTSLMEEMQDAEVVVATRYHNVICALKVGRPVVSLRYASKNTPLMTAFGLGAYDQPMEAFDVDRVHRQVARLRAESTSWRGRVTQARDRHVADLEGYLDRLFVDLLPPARRAGVARRGGRTR
jgi:polysaccharide pyruvyl transferase WcaK-like protein/glycosyltransferase involved in cell wall biosynthesis